MTYLFNLVVFVLGSSIVSFLTVIAHDFPKIQLNRRSQCNNCQNILSWYELIPIFSFILTGGNCKKCNFDIPIMYPITETIGGLYLIVVLIKDKDIYFAIPLMIMLVTLSFMDYFYGYIYPVCYALILPTFIYALLHGYPLYFITGILTYSALFLMNHFYQSIGLGDVELLGLLAILFGYEDILKIILISCLLCIIHYFGNKKRSFRFIPYITAATGIVYLIS
ncbi:prepilin peptidase [Companilactobacillus jidongensis]|uniref:prepilin peptidase n=1 Tax=Companilactobacillus jidongensis TaxID=2486006 RepID=UPI000F7ABCD3|nr:A24 family peptidase [Companilactobacillus jidongensis]